MTKQQLKPKRYRRPSKWEYGPEVRAIFEWFIKPFGDHFTPGLDERGLEANLEAFFNTRTRSVDLYRATCDFVMPGKIQHEHPTIYVSGTKNRGIKLGDGVVVRVDDTMPDRIDAEWNEVVFLLNAAEWTTVKEKLKFVV